jgi:hypothetical protein
VFGVEELEVVVAEVEEQEVEAEGVEDEE